ncbi:MAG: hypothetical protein HWE11_10620 [Gammaproteobacteria bacterium]|nr:hypothetical protein [Gammaproteobacteria bacterium]
MSKIVQLDQILCFGDSFTAGEGDDCCGGWVARLRSERMRSLYAATADDLPQLRVRQQVYELGVGGETVDGLVLRMAREYQARAHQRARRWVLLQYGSNDVIKVKQKNRVPLAIFLRKMTQAIDFFRQQGCRVAVMSIWPVIERFDGCCDEAGWLRHNADIDSYNQALAELCLEQQVTWLRLAFDGHRDQAHWAPDGVHPSAQGHDFIALHAKAWLAQN